MLAVLQALWLVLRRGPRCVVGMGGYVSGPAGVAAWMLRKPLVIQEQNAVAGTTNRTAGTTGEHAFLLAFPGAFDSNMHYTVLGNPVRRELLQARADRLYDYAGQRPLRLLVVGGSLGARPINDVVPGAIKRLVSRVEIRSIEVWHQTGQGHDDAVRPALRSVAGSRRTRGALYRGYGRGLFLGGLGPVSLRRVDDHRALCIVGRPAILVPLPQAIDDHQTANARALTDCGGATRLCQRDLDARAVLSLLTAVSGQSTVAYLTMAAAAFAAAIPDAAERVSDCCEELMYA